MHPGTLRALGVLALTLVVATAEVSAQQRFEWTSQPDMPTARSGMASAVLDGKIYVAGGRDQMERALDLFHVYDPEARSWETLEPLPTARFDAAAVAFRGRVVVIGGRGFEPGLPPGQQKRLVYDVVEAYDPVDGRWESWPSLLVGRDGLAAFVLDDSLFVVGGSDDRERILQTVEYLDESQNEWRIADWLGLDVPRAGFAVVVARGRPFAIGGFTPLPVSTIFELRGRSGVPRPQAFRARGGHAAVVVGDSIFVLGGRGATPAPPGNPRGVLSNVDLFVPASGEWEEVRPMPSGRESFSAVVINERIYVLGGRSEGGQVLQSVETLEERTTVASENPGLPSDFYLEPAVPNPFADRTRLSFGVSGQTTSASSITIYDVAGRRVRTLVQSTLAPGRHEIEWDGIADNGTRVASGVYLCVLTQGLLRTHEIMVHVR